MIVKKLRSGTYIFEKTSGMTAFFSDNEEKKLYAYFKTGKENEFIKRLYKLNILTKYENIIEKTDDIYLQSIHIDITDSCPLRCPQCYKNESIDKFMSLETFKSIIDEAEKLNCFQIAIGGGEPFIHKNIFQMIEYVSKTQMAISVTSSGITLNKEKIQFLENIGLNHLQISLNGSNYIVNSLSRDGFEHSMNALKLLSGSNISFGINTVIRQDNIDDLENIFSLGKMLGVENVNLLRYKPNKYEDYNIHKLDNNHVSKLIKIIKSNLDLNIKVDSAFTPLLMLFTNGNISDNQSGCGALSEFINITVDGKYKPCSHVDLEEKATSIFNYYTKSNNKQKLEKIEYIKGASCLQCKFKEKCFGCLAISQYDNLQISKGEKECIFCMEGE